MEWTQERRERLEAAPLHVKGCPLAHAPNRISSCPCGLDIFAALSEIDRLTARVEALEGCRRFVAMLACSCPGPCETASDARDDCCAAHDALAALTPPAGEEPAGRLEERQSVSTSQGAGAAVAPTQSPRPPSESEVEEANVFDQGPFSKLVDAEWQTLLDKDDRTSPAEYPEMCLLTRTELAGAMTEAFFLGTDQARPPSEDAAARVTEDDLARIIAKKDEPGPEDFKRARAVLAYFIRQMDPADSAETD